MKEIASISKNGCVRAYGFYNSFYLEVPQEYVDKFMSAREKENGKKTDGFFIINDDLGIFAYKSR